MTGTAGSAGRSEEGIFKQIRTRRGKASSGILICHFLFGTSAQKNDLLD
jgi:hypothetical protein